MRILLDVDGPLAQFVPAAVRVVNDLGGTRFIPEDATTWEVADLLPEELRQAFWERVTAAGFCAALEPVEGAVEAVRELRKKHDVYFVTSDMATCPTWAHERREWLKRHFGVHYRNIVHTHAKYLVRGDLLIDDKPSHLDRWGSENSPPRAWLWGMPHNASVQANWNTLHHWSDALNRIAALTRPASTPPPDAWQAERMAAEARNASTDELRSIDDAFGVHR